MGGSSQVERSESLTPIEHHSKGAQSSFPDKGAMYYTSKDISEEEPSMAPGRIFLGRLRADVDRDTLFEVLSKFGNVLDARIVAATKDGHKKRFAFCDLDTIESATAAIHALHGCTDLGEPTLVATHSTDTRPSPSWSSAGTENYYRPSPPNTNYNPIQMSAGTKPSAYGLPWQPQYFTTPGAVTPPPPPPPPPPVVATENVSDGPVKPSVREAVSSSSSSSSSGRVVAPSNNNNTTQRVSSPRPMLEDTVAAIDAPVQQQQEQPQPQYHGHVVSSHVMHPVMPIVATAPMSRVPTPSPALIPVTKSTNRSSVYEEDQITTLYVRGLPLEMDEMGLLHFYMPFGAVVATKILRNLDSLRSRGAGFIEFFTRQESDAALRGTNRAMGPAGRPLLVHYAERQLHCSRGAAQAMSAPVWPVMPYPAATAAAAAGAGAVPATAVPVPFPVAMPVPVGYIPPHNYGGPPPPPAATLAMGDGQKDSAAGVAAAGSVAVGVPPPAPSAPHQVALTVGHPIHPQAYHPYNPYQLYHPAHGAAAGWQQQHQQQQSYHPVPHHLQHHQQQCYGYQHPHYYTTATVGVAGNNKNSNNAMIHQQQPQYAPAAAPTAAHYQPHHQMQQVHPHAHAKPASSFDSSGSDTSSAVVRRPGDPVVVVYSNIAKQTANSTTNTSSTGSFLSNNNTSAAGAGGGSVRSAQHGMPYPVNVHAGRHPLRNISMNGSGGGSHSAATTPGGAMPVGMPQKHTGSGGGGGGSGNGNAPNPLGLERTSSDPFPNALSASEMEAICSRVKAAARNVIHANNAINAAAVAAKKKKVHGGGTPDLVITKRSNNNNGSSSNTTIDSEDSSSSLADSVGSCVSSAAVVPAGNAVAAEIPLS